MVEIIPAIMPESYDDLRTKVRQVVDHATVVQIDIMDGKFVQSVDWPYNHGGPLQHEEFQALIAQDEGLPYWDKIDYELDLMIQAPEKSLDLWLPLGASRLVFHLASILDRDHFFRGELFAPGARTIGPDTVIAVGLAITPDSDIQELLPYISQIDFVQCMGITRVGYQRQSFDERVLTQIHALRVAYPELPISVDGAVNMDTAHDLIGAGASRLVSGSAIFDSGDIASAIASLRRA